MKQNALRLTDRPRSRVMTASGQAAASAARGLANARHDVDDAIDAAGKMGSNSRVAGLIDEMERIRTAIDTALDNADRIKRGQT